MERSRQGGVLRRILCAAILTLLLSHEGQSQTTPADQNSTQTLTQLSLEQLGEIEVTSVSKEPEEVRKTPAAIYVLTQEDIRRSGATSIPEVLRLVPGVEVARVDSDHWAIGIRGFGSGFSKYVLVLIDGRSVYTPLYEGVYWDVQNVPLEDVDRIEVIRGPGGTIWGANAVNGVINIITKNAKDTQGSLASTGGGTVDRSTGTIRYGGSLGENFNYRIYGMGFARNSERHADGDPYDDWRKGQAGFRADWKEHDRDTFTFQGDIYSGTEGERISIGFFSPPAQLSLDGTASVSGGNLLARWQRQFDDGSDIQLQAYFDRTNRQDIQLGETRNTFDVDFIHHLVLPKHNNFIWGLGVRISPSSFIETQPTVNFLPNKQTDSIYSGFLQDEIAIVPRKLSVTLGTKLEHNNFNGFDYQPSARVLWTPSDRQSVWSAVTRAVRTPSRLDQDLDLIAFASEYAATYPVFLEGQGNPNYRPEVMLGYEAGYRALITSRFHLDLSAFFNNYNGIQSFGSESLTFKQSPPPSPYAYLDILVPVTNGLIGNTDGVEINPDWQMTNWWHLKGSYSYLQIHLKDKSGITDTATPITDVGSSPHHDVVVQSQFDLPNHLEIDPTYRYVSALPAQSVKSYSTMDVRLGWRLRKGFEFSVAGQNLFQPYHVEFGGDPGPLVGIKRSVYGKIVWTRPR